MSIDTKERVIETKRLLVFQVFQVEVGTRKMDGYPVLQIVRCRLGMEMEMDNQGYPFTMAAHSHSHLPHPANHAHLPRSHYPHPCGMPINPSC